VILHAAMESLAVGDARGALLLLDQCATEERPALHAIRGMALLATNQPAAAIVAFEAAIAADDHSASTRLNLALATDAAGDPQLARDMMRDVAACEPAWDEPHLRLAESFRRQHDRTAALDAYQQALARHPNRVESLIGSGALLVEQGDGARARETLRHAVDLAPSHAEAWDALGLALLLDRNMTSAGSAFAVARRLDPCRIEVALHAVDAAIGSNAAAAELTLAEIAATNAPHDPLHHVVRGLLLDHLGRRTEAIDALQVATALAPEAALPISLLGGLLARGLRLSEATVALRQAQRIAPDDARVSADLGAVLMRTHHPAEACEILHDLLRRCPPQIGILCNLANASAGCGNQDDAIAVSRQAIALNPASPLPWRTLLGTLPYADGVDGATMLRAARDCALRIPATANAPPRRTPGGRLRIGLISGSFRTHPVGWLTVAGLETLDPTSFDLIFFSQNAGTDQIARRFRQIAQEWFTIDDHDDHAVAAMINAAQIDILIDLGGFGEGGRMSVCALRPAPVQVKWVGMQCHSTGLPAIDWFLSDRWETPPELEKFYSERIMRLDEGYVCYSPPPHAPDVAPLPALENGFITFGCFNNLAKITPRVLAAWASILRRVPTARLIVKSPQLAHAGTAKAMRETLQRHGIPATRVTLQGPSRHRDFLAEYNKIDIVLDPFPYSGGLTTCEALWMGVPTITVPGETFASRHSLSHLSNVGLPDWAASSIPSYIEQAVARASAPSALATLRAGLRARVKASPLCDAPRFGKSLGSALQIIWQSHRDDRPAHVPTHPPQAPQAATAAE
jgi:predicted O-linked N-acetylglucosamine transferase (SPINDLY family)